MAEESKHCDNTSNRGEVLSTPSSLDQSENTKLHKGFIKHINLKSDLNSFDQSCPFGTEHHLSLSSLKYSWLNVDRLYARYARCVPAASEKRMDFVLTTIKKKTAAFQIRCRIPSAALTFHQGFWDSHPDRTSLCMKLPLCVMEAWQTFHMLLLLSLTRLHSVCPQCERWAGR